jgi:HK97 family phage major capsid protein
MTSPYRWPFPPQRRPVVLIPQNLHSEVIELLSDRTIVRKLGARPVPLPNGNMTLPRVAGGATASYTGEGKMPRRLNQNSTT